MAELERYDAVVVGSGFGGSVVAARLAEAGRSVLVLERGRPYPPGSFARSPHRLRSAFWDPGAGLHGLFDARSFPHFDAVVASGLGGGSLIYANVMLRKDADTFADPDGRPWPVSRDELEEHYDRVEAVQRPAAYPYPDTTPKTRALLGAGRALGFEGELPPLAIAFAPADGAPAAPGMPLADGANLHGRPRLTCRLCGGCDLGCNEGAKQTLDLTYLSAAAAAGAMIRCLCEATGLTPDGDGGWLVRYRQHRAGAGAVDPALLDPSGDERRTVAAGRVVLAAGTFGSPKLLLANRAGLPRLSGAVGTRFCTNGDLLGFVRGADRPLEPSLGPVITASLTTPHGRVQDAGAPYFADWLWQLTEVPRDLWGLRGALARRLVDRLLGRRTTALGGLVSSAFGTTRASAAMMPLLAMGRDQASGTMRLRGDELVVDWHERDSAALFAELERAMRDVGAALGGRTRVGRLSRTTTVHPLGGCPMGRDPGEGVVDDRGRVFGHPGLHVADGSILPGPVGPNPSFTIAALADRAADEMLGE